MASKIGFSLSSLDFRGNGKSQKKTG